MTKTDFGSTMATLIKCGVCGGTIASNAPACPHCGSPQKAVQSGTRKPVPMAQAVDSPWWRSTTGILIATLLVNMTIAAVLYLLFREPAVPQVDARKELTHELDEWVAGRKSKVVPDQWFLYRPILESYSIVDISLDSVDGRKPYAPGSGIFDATVNLKVSMKAGGTRTYQVRYQLIIVDGSRNASIQTFADVPSILEP